MNQKVMFKTTTFGGFEKRAVLNYILQLNKTTEEAQAQMGEQLRVAVEAKQQMEHELAVTQSRAEQLQSDLDQATAQLTAEKTRNTELTTSVEQLSVELDQQRQLLAQLESQAQDAQRQSLEMIERNRELEEKRQEIDQVSAQMGKLMIDARTEAEQVVAMAHAEAQQIQSRIQMEAQQNLEATTARTREMEQRAQLAMERVSSQFNTFRRDLETIQSTVMDAVLLMQDKMQSAKGLMDELGEQFTFTGGTFAMEPGVAPESALEEAAEEYLPGEYAAGDYSPYDAAGVGAETTPALDYTVDPGVQVVSEQELERIAEESGGIYG